MTKKLEKKIGSGGFGVVYYGRLLDGSREVAVKILNENDAPNQFSNEVFVTNIFLSLKAKLYTKSVSICSSPIHFRLFLFILPLCYNGCPFSLINCCHYSNHSSPL